MQIPHKGERTIEIKICKTCKDTFPLTEEFFRKNGFAADGTQKFRPECRKCSRKSKSGSNFASSTKQERKNEARPIQYDKPMDGQLSISNINLDPGPGVEIILTKKEVVDLKIILDHADEIIKYIVANDSQSIHTSSQLGANKFATENHNRLKKSYNVNEYLVNWVRTYSQQKNISASDVVNQALGEYYERVANECEQMNKK